VNKIACENILEVYANRFDIPYTVYRICVPYGSSIGRDYSYGTVGNFLRQAREGRRITLFGDGSLRRTFTHVEDVCTQMLVSCWDKRSVNETFNIGGETQSLRATATLIANSCGAKLEFASWPEHDLRIESGHTVFNSDKLSRIFSVYPKHSIASWLNGLDKECAAEV
jgi:UDP-glucose 4-epimerase